jgi:mono/diheme cytochrome c family protein
VTLPHISNRSSDGERLMLRQWKPLLAGLLLGWASGLAALGIGAAIMIGFGLYDVSATTPHMPWFGWLVHRTMIRSVKVRATEMAPRSFTQAQLTRGFQLYESHCAVCHGGPGISRARWVDGLTPTPPYLLGAARQWSPSQLHFIIANGVKMTAMPGWKLTLSGQDIWSLVAFTQGLRGMSQRTYLRMRAAQTKPKPPAASALPTVRSEKPSDQFTDFVGHSR